MELVTRYYTLAQVAGMYGMTQQEVADNFKLTKIGQYYRIAEEDLHVNTP